MRKKSSSSSARKLQRTESCISNTVQTMADTDEIILPEEQEFDSDSTNIEQVPSSRKFTGSLTTVHTNSGHSSSDLPPEDTRCYLSSVNMASGSSTAQDLPGTKPHHFTDRLDIDKMVCITWA